MQCALNNLNRTKQIFSYVLSSSFFYRNNEFFLQQNKKKPSSVLNYSNSMMASFNCQNRHVEIHMKQDYNWTFSAYEDILINK